MQKLWQSRHPKAFSRRLKTLLRAVLVLLALAIPAGGAAEAPEQAEPARQASNFTLQSLAGNQVSLDEFRGQYLLVNFWATWCGPCKLEMPSLEALYQRFKHENFHVIGISNDMFGAKVVRPYVEANQISFPVLLDQRLTVSRQFGVVSLPTTFLIDPQGQIIGVRYGAEDWSDPQTLNYFKNLLQTS